MINLEGYFWWELIYYNHSGKKYPQKFFYPSGSLTGKDFSGFKINIDIIGQNSKGLFLRLTLRMTRIVLVTLLSNGLCNPVRFMWTCCLETSILVMRVNSRHV